jgi:hypothetical protein
MEKFKLIQKETSFMILHIRREYELTFKFEYLFEYELMVKIIKGKNPGNQVGNISDGKIQR